jgi:hypothetical protein
MRVVAVSGKGVRTVRAWVVPDPQGHQDGQGHEDMKA